MAIKFIGSICLTDIPKSQIKVVNCKDGKQRAFLAISIHENKQPFTDDNGKLLQDHFISCAPKKEERIDGEKYIIGHLKTWQNNETPNANPTPEQINNAPTLDQVDTTLDLPF